jgi:predicted flap endonuclease-1-like 5' DNA nuclease
MESIPPQLLQSPGLTSLCSEAIARPMSMIDILLLAGIVLGLACIFLIMRGSKKELPKSPEKAAETAIEAAVVEPANAPQAVPTAPETAAPVAASPFLAAPDGAADDLSRIKGIGPKLSTRLAELGVFHYRQIAGWTPAQLAEVDAQLGNFAGRPERDQWQSQARLLSEGDVKAYERVHGKLGPAA